MFTLSPALISASITRKNLKDSKQREKRSKEGQEERKRQIERRKETDREKESDRETVYVLLVILNVHFRSREIEHRSGRVCRSQNLNRERKRIRKG